MASMVVFTEPERKILQASADLAERTGASQKEMAGAPCSRTVRCRNARGEPLCHNLCPALMAARARSGEVDVPVWLEGPSGQLVAHRGRFEQVAGVTNGAVVAFFSEVEPSAASGRDVQVPLKLLEDRASGGGNAAARQGTPRHRTLLLVAAGARSTRKRPALTLVSG